MILFAILVLAAAIAFVAGRPEFALGILFVALVLVVFGFVDPSAAR